MFFWVVSDFLTAQDGCRGMDRSQEKSLLQLQHNEELRQLRSQLTSAKDAEEELSTRHEAEARLAGEPEA